MSKTKRIITGVIPAILALVSLVLAAGANSSWG